MNRVHRPPALGLHRLEPRDNPAAFAAYGAAAGGLPLVELQRPDGVAVARFPAFEASFDGGVRAVAGELDGDRNTVEVVAAAGPGGGPHVRVFRVNLAANNAVDELASFYAFEEGFNGGVRVAVGNVGGPDSRQELIVGADANGGPRVRTLSLNGSTATPISGPLGDFFAFEPTFTGGVRVAAGELDGNTANGSELVVAAGQGGGPRVRVLRADGSVVSDYYAFRPDFGGGVNVATDASAGAVGRLLTDGETADVSQRLTSLNALSVNGLTGNGNGSSTSNGSGNTGGTTNTRTNGTTGGLNGNGIGVNGDGTSTTSDLTAADTTSLLAFNTANLNTTGVGLGATGNPLFVGQTFGTFTNPNFGVFGSPGVLTPFSFNGFNGTNTTGVVNTNTIGTLGPFAGGLGAGTVF